MCKCQITVVCTQIIYGLVYGYSNPPNSISLSLRKPNKPTFDFSRQIGHHKKTQKLMLRAFSPFHQSVLLRNCAFAKIPRKFKVSSSLRSRRMKNIGRARQLSHRVSPSLALLAFFFSHPIDFSRFFTLRYVLINNLEILFYFHSTSLSLNFIKIYTV